MIEFYEKGYPRPQFMREPFFFLNGEWNFRFDLRKERIKCGWQNGFEDHKIIVPFSREGPAGGIRIQDECNTVWYSRSQLFEPHEGERVLLNFEGSDYRTEFWVNRIYMGVHEGGYTRFIFDITEALKKAGNQLVCCIEDTYSTIQPRGKQRWLRQDYDCRYTQTTGIWKDAWAGETDSSYLTTPYLTPLYDENSLEVDRELNLWRDSSDSFEIETIITFENFIIYSGRDKVIKNAFSKKISLVNNETKWKIRYRCPGSPNLYGVCIRIYRNGKVIDEIGSYFGSRKIPIDSGGVKFSNMDFYLKMVPDQDYWESSPLTPPDGEALILDIEKILEYGCNGARKHQRIENERFHYRADIYGLIAWCEALSFYEFDRRAIECVTKKWVDIVKQHYGHPPITAQVPFNESQGIPGILCDKEQQVFTETIHYLARSLSATRSVIGNDEWERTKSDITILHNYAEYGEDLLSHWMDWE